MVRTVIFDADGVLIDSLSMHLRFCELKALDYGLSVKIPSPPEFKRLVHQGICISPMKYFFLAVGFNEADAKRADADYQNNFLREQRPPLFPGVGEMLKALKKAGIQLGIVTSNVRANIVGPIGNLLALFGEDLIVTKDHPYYVTKTEAVNYLTNLLTVKPTEVLFVGDQYLDAEAAKATGTRFLGVTYGWCFDPSFPETFPLARDPRGIAEYVLPRLSSR